LGSFSVAIKIKTIISFIRPRYEFYYFDFSFLFLTSFKPIKRNSVTVDRYASTYRITRSHYTMDKLRMGVARLRVGSLVRSRLKLLKVRIFLFIKPVSNLFIGFYREIITVIKVERILLFLHFLFSVNRFRTSSGARR
jgi:hypothetical protein